MTKNGSLNSNYLRNDNYKNKFPELALQITSLTDFLPPNSTITERIYCIVNNIHERPKCICGQYKKFHGKTHGYSSFCSTKCSNDNDVKKSKTKETKFKKYGDGNYINSAKISRFPSYYDIHFHGKYSQSKNEREIIDFIKQLDPNINIIERYYDYNAQVEYDIYLKDLNIAIEHHGVYWHSFNSKESKEQQYCHYNKYQAASNANIKLFQIYETEWNDDIKRDIWKSIIKQNIQGSQRFFARKCKIKVFDKKDFPAIRDFLHVNHLQGKCAFSYACGLYYNDVLVQVMCFSHIKADQTIELVRLCGLKDFCIVGGASKLLKHFIGHIGNQIKRIITFSDNRYSTGKVYLQLGFHYDKKVKISYYYTDLKKLYHKRLFQKTQIKKILGNKYIDSMTESDLIFNFTKYRRIWDAGKHRFVLFC